MSIFDGQGDPILIVSMDLIEESDEDVATVISILKPLVSDAEFIEKKDILTRLITSDSWNKRIRIPILITDALQVQMVGSNASSGTTVNYIDNAPQVDTLIDSVSVELTLKNSLGDLSVISDVLSSVFTRIFSRYTTSARASFFGNNVCIFNGFITGVNRQTVGDTDKERLNLTFERAPDNPKTAEKDEKKPVPKEKGGTIAEPTPRPPLEDGTETSNDFIFTTAANGSNANAGGSSEGRVFLWYNLGTLADYFNSPVPQIFNTETVNRLDFLTFVAQSKDFTGTLRQAITVVYDNVNIPLGINGHFPYYSPNPDSPLGYAIDTQNGFLYLGVEAVANES